MGFVQFIELVGTVGLMYGAVGGLLYLVESAVGRKKDEDPVPARILLGSASLTIAVGALVTSDFVQDAVWQRVWRRAKRVDI
jgi:hypothetical protein